MTRPDDRQDTARTPPADRPEGPEGLSVAEAAARLGVTPDAVRRRLHRGTLAGAKDGAGEWRVRLPDDEPPGPQPGGRQDTARTRQDDPPALVAALEDEVRWLRAELAVRTDELQRRDVLLREALERIPALPAGQDAAVAAPGGPGAAERPEPAADARPWWRRWLGLG